MDSSGSENIREKFNSDWRIKITDLADQIGHFYLDEELADVFFVFRRDNTTQVFFSLIYASDNLMLLHLLRKNGLTDCF